MYIAAIRHPVRHDMPLWPEVTYHVASSKVDILKIVNENRRPDWISTVVREAHVTNVISVSTREEI